MLEREAPRVGIRAGLSKLQHVGWRQQEMVKDFLGWAMLEFGQLVHGFRDRFPEIRQRGIGRNGNLMKP